MSLHIVRLTRSGVCTTPVGLGLATLMREPSPRKRRALLDGSFDAGVRHYDVAPSYGLGRAESTLSPFLAAHAGQVTVATKLGLAPSKLSPLLRVVERPARWMFQRIPSLRRRAVQTVGSSHTAITLTAHDAERSLTHSLRALRVEHLDILLLHDVSYDSLQASGLDSWLHQVVERGLVGQVGLATSHLEAKRIAGSKPKWLDVVQLRRHDLDADHDSWSDHLFKIEHGVLSMVYARVRERIANAPSARQALSDALGDDVLSPNALASLMLAYAVRGNPTGISLVGVSSPHHLPAIERALKGYPDPAYAALSSFVETIRSETL